MSDHESVLHLGVQAYCLYSLTPELKVDSGLARLLIESMSHWSAGKIKALHFPSVS